DRARRVPPRNAEPPGGGEPSHHPSRDRRRREFPRQLLGLQRWKERDSHGESASGRLPRESFPDDQDRRPDADRGRPPDRGVAPTTPDGRHRSVAVPRGHSDGGSGADLRRRRGDRGSARGEGCREDPLHRFHGTQESRDSPPDARDGRGARVPVRHGPDAAERDGRALRELREEGAADPREGGDRSPRDEAPRGSSDPGQQDREPYRVPSLYDEPPDERRDHGLRLDGNPRAGAPCRPDLPAAVARGGASPSGQDRQRGEGRCVRTLQDDARLRLDRGPSAVARVRIPHARAPRAPQASNCATRISSAVGGGAFAWLALVLLVVQATASVSAGLAPHGTLLAAHGPIAIVNDSDFTPANGVTGGNGTPSDPYVIEGWSIESPSTH